MARVDARVEGLAHLAGAQGRVVLAFAHLNTHLFGTDRRRAAAGQRLESRTTGCVGISGRVNLAVDPGLVQPGDAGDGADLGVDRGAGLRLGRGDGVGHIGLHADAGTGVSRGGDKGNLVGRPANGGQNARAALGGLGPFFDGIAD